MTAFYFILIMFLDNSFILSDSVCSLPSILTSKYILRVIGKPTETIRVCKSNGICMFAYLTHSSIVWNYGIRKQNIKILTK